MNEYYAHVKSLAKEGLSETQIMRRLRTTRGKITVAYRVTCLSQEMQKDYEKGHLTLENVNNLYFVRHNPYKLAELWEKIQAGMIATTYPRLIDEAIKESVQSESEVILRETAGKRTGY